MERQRAESYISRLRIAGIQARLEKKEEDFGFAFTLKRGKKFVTHTTFQNDFDEVDLGKLLIKAQSPQ